ncbi:MAG: 23S rRNA (pseudouridine(1915)-N(3))-methyltransferase RlmH [Elusimicrobia bacterium]|nr:23S rRNA (pseudouridine(1915)-N(3))-methyltransferase RlmH [Elusimicrobiota bacterium]
MPGAHDAFDEFARRLSRGGPFEAAGGLPAKGTRLWLLDRGPGSRVLSSEDVAGRLAAERDGGTRVLEVLVGPADGFTPAEVSALAPSLRWSFGPLTLPHELAAVVAAEQLYRARTILQGAPYHLGH